MAVEKKLEVALWSGERQLAHEVVIVARAGTI